MTDPTCARCGKPSPGADICTHCANHLARCLAGSSEWASTDALLAELPITIARQDVVERPTPTRTDPESTTTLTDYGTRPATNLLARKPATETALRPTTMPFSWEAADAAWTIHDTLTKWSNHCAEERGIAVIGTPATWLIGQTEWLRHRPEGPEAYDELHYAIRLLRYTVDTPPDRAYAGRCQCGTRLYRAVGAPLIRCHGCALELDLDGYRTLMLAQLGHRSLPAADIATLAAHLDIGARIDIRNLIKVWRQRGVVTPDGVQKDGAPTYLIATVMNRLMTTTRERTVA